MYRRSNNIQTFIDITNVTELHTHQMSTDNLVIGGSVNLTELMEILTKASKTVGFEYATELVNHIDLIANVPVRNVTKNLLNLHKNEIKYCGKFYCRLEQSLEI